MLELGPAFPVSYEGVPPHVSSADFLLWEQFRARFGARYQRFWFDVGVGSGVPPAPGTPANLVAAWKRLTSFRIDAIGDTGAAWHLLEFRPNAGPSALGSLQVYASLLAPDVPADRTLETWIVTDHCTPDIGRVAALYGVQVLCLAESGPEVVG